MRSRRLLVALASGLALAASHRLAAASPDYSALLGQHVGAATAPPCSVCHAADSAVDPTAMTLFAQALRERGFTDESNLVAAFDQMAADKVDSDGDRSLDTDEVAWGGDPNDSDGLRGDPAPEIQHGCGVGPAPGAASASTPLAVGLLLAAFGLRRRH